LPRSDKPAKNVGPRLKALGAGALAPCCSILLKLTQESPRIEVNRVYLIDVLHFRLRR
jgi:hypothetical protein